MNLDMPNQWFAEQPTLLPSLDAMIAEDLSDGIHPGLAPIPEEEWDFGWEKEPFTELESHPCPEESSNPFIEGGAKEAVPLQVIEELSNLREQVRRLRNDISELQEISAKRLDSMERSVIVAQRYVNNLVPWSMEVHENYSRLLEVAERQEKGGADRIQH